MNKNECRTIVQAGLEELTEIVGVEATAFRDHDPRAMFSSRGFFGRYDRGAACRRGIERLFKRLPTSSAGVRVMAARSALMRYFPGKHVWSTDTGWLQALEEYIDDCGLKISYETVDRDPGSSSIDTLHIGPQPTIAGRFRSLVFEFVFHQFTSDCEGLSNYAFRKMLAQAEIISFAVSRAARLESRSQNTGYIVEMHGDEELIRESRYWLDDMASELLFELVERCQRQRNPNAGGSRQA